MKTIPIVNSIKEVIVDDDMYEYLSQWTWFDNGKYACRKPRSGIIKMHHLVLPKKQGMDVDHINRNSYDNRRENLRYATRSLNMLNKTPHPRRKRGEFVGVDYNSSKKLWRAYISVFGKQKTLGKFKSKIHAGVMRDFWASYLYGKGAVLNFPLVSVGGEESLSIV